MHIYYVYMHIYTFILCIHIYIYVLYIYTHTHILHMTILKYWSFAVDLKIITIWLGGLLLFNPHYMITFQVAT